MRIRRRLLTDVYEEIKGSSVKTNMWKIRDDPYWNLLSPFNRDLAYFKGRIYEENKSAFL